MTHTMGSQDSHDGRLRNASFSSSIWLNTLWPLACPRNFIIFSALAPILIHDSTLLLFLIFCRAFSVYTYHLSYVKRSTSLLCVHSDPSVTPWPGGVGCYRAMFYCDRTRYGLELYPPGGILCVSMCTIMLSLSIF